MKREGCRAGAGQYTQTHKKRKKLAVWGREKKLKRRKRNVNTEHLTRKKNLPPAAAATPFPGKTLLPGGNLPDECRTACASSARAVETLPPRPCRRATDPADAHERSLHRRVVPAVHAASGIPSTPAPGKLCGTAPGLELRARGEAGEGACRAARRPGPALPADAADQGRGEVDTTAAAAAAAAATTTATVAPIAGCPRRPGCPAERHPPRQPEVQGRRSAPGPRVEGCEAAARAGRGRRPVRRGRRGHRCERAASKEPRHAEGAIGR